MGLALQLLKIYALLMLTIWLANIVIVILMR